MKKIYAFLCLFVVLLHAYGNHNVSIDGFLSPRSIVATNTDVFVSNMGDTPNLTRNGSGFISKLDSTGKIIDFKFISNLNFPSGMVILGNILYVADVNTIKGFNIATKKQVLNLPISSTNTLNDVSVRDSTHLFVADGKTGLILLIDLKKKSYYTFVEIDNMLGDLQHIDSDKKFLYVSTFDSKNIQGYILRIDIETKEMSVLHKFFEKICDFQLTKDGGIITANMGQNNEVKFYKISRNARIYSIDTEESIQDVANVAKIFIDKNSLWITDTLDNKVNKITPTR